MNGWLLEITKKMVAFDFPFSKKDSQRRDGLVVGKLLLWKSGGTTISTNKNIYKYITQILLLDKIQ